nr:MAG TPA: endosialidase chaperone [Caudoviricetes sp.]
MNDAGKVAFTPKGDYSSTVTYEYLDTVVYNGNAYVALKTTAGNVPEDGSKYWILLARGGTSVPVATEDIKGAVKASEDIGVDSDAKMVLKTDFTEQTNLTDIQSGESRNTFFGKIAKAVSELISHINVKASTSATGHVKLSDSSAVTDSTGLALPATEKNASISGTMANQISELNTDVNKKQDALTAITTSNIGSQSVKYATSAGSANAVAWSKVTGKPSTYAPASHNHAGQSLNPASLEISAVTPFIDFHHNKSSKDYTTRIIDGGDALCFLNAVNNSFMFQGYQNHEVVITAVGEFSAHNDSCILRSPYNVQCTSLAGNTYIPVFGASFTNPSSRLVKENIINMSEEEAKKILLLNPVDFDYIKEFGGEKNQKGLIAEDVLNIIPSCVTVPDGYSEEEFDASKGIKNKVLAIDYSKLIPYLIKIVQMQQEEIEALKHA